MQSEILGIDVGGSGIKGALVDVHTGTLTTERHRIPTPESRSPAAVMQTIGELVDHFGYRGKGAIGIGFPFVTVDGVPQSPFSALAIEGWVGTPIGAQLSKQLGVPVTLVNDADAAGLAEINFGVGKGQSGVCIVLTLGTGVGSGLFYNGRLVPNTELGKLYLQDDKKLSERRVAASIREERELTWEEYAPELDEYLKHVERLFSPQLMIIGGGASKHFAKYGPLLTTQTKVVAAELRNHAGIIGAAMAAEAASK